MKTKVEILTESITLQKESLTDLLNRLSEHAELLERFSFVTGELMSGKWWICLHEPKDNEAAKQFAREWGGQWFRRDECGRILYEHTLSIGGKIHIFGAESSSVEPLAL